jgi:hypothetical protein
MTDPEFSASLVRFAARKLANVDRETWRGFSDEARRDYRDGAERVLRAEQEYLQQQKSG